ncbi:MAG: maleylacetoacetate isomerase [Kangiellaceae bacterium]|jgi:maleylacetoacetate isomerase/maleylpyruvate isomerase|nr:maleylacetoacetate isomerase [Kangiellaceae bacterium]
MIKLYGYWRSTAAYRVRIALNLKQVSYENISVHLVKDGGEQYKPEYLSHNPQGLVPLLVDGDLKLNQSSAIVDFLEEKYPTPSLYPEDIETKARVRAFCQTIACDVHPLNNLRVLKYLTQELAVDDGQKSRWYAHWINKGFAALESTLASQNVTSEYCFGDTVTMADLFLIPQVYNANRFNVDLSPYPRIVDINQRCLERKVFQDAAPEHQPDAG